MATILGELHHGAEAAATDVTIRVAAHAVGADTVIPIQHTATDEEIQTGFGESAATFYMRKETDS